MDYKIFITAPLQIGSVTIPKGCYEVIKDNMDYDKKPSYAFIKYDNNEFTILINEIDLYSRINPDQPLCIPVYPDFDSAMLDAEKTDAEIFSDLEGLRPATMLVHEYFGGNDDDWIGFGTIREAWQIAVLNDWSHRFVTQKRAIQVMVESFKNRN